MKYTKTFTDAKEMVSFFKQKFNLILLEHDVLAVLSNQKNTLIAFNNRGEVAKVFHV